MKRHYPRLIIVTFFSIFFYACSPKEHVPEDVLSVKEMSAVMLDLQLAKAYNPSYYARNNTDSTYPKDQKKRLQVFYQQVLLIHHIDTAKFFHSFQFYANHPIWIQKVLSNVKDSLDTRLSKIQNSIGNKRFNLTPKEKEALFMKFWKQDLNILRSFFDSTYQRESMETNIWSPAQTNPIIPPDSNRIDSEPMNPQPTPSAFKHKENE
ncbi:MAG TPA: DUF4296 domain-containing protein [Chitinophagaceae bacterium]|nr:DUF4296 domain-containing protein [Chitinophagaceae bacterium]